MRDQKSASVRSTVAILFAGLFASATASAQSISIAPPGQVSRGQAMPTTPPMVVVARQPELRGNLGGGFIEYLFGDQSRPRAELPPRIYSDPSHDTQRYANTQPTVGPMLEPQGTAIDPQFLRQQVDYQGSEEPGTIVIDTPNHFLYLVEPGGKAMRYGIGVGRPGFTWSGVHSVSSMKEWPDWVPPKEMLQRQPYLPHHMAGGPNNPLGARALYLGSTLYRIHGSNEPWTIGRNVSSGCIRMRNADVIDLYGRVKIGTKVVVL
ncbi:MAG: L,D-transpeptidase [Rhizobiales bacterium]|nr:L,D-transpeptidase [Hyphomicrobiales bacterium]